MEIKRNNIEQFLQDFAEGRLDPSRELELLLFLDENPDLAAELDAWNIKPSANDIPVFPGKPALKKEFPGQKGEITDANLDFYCIADLEGDLTDEQRRVWDNYLSGHPGALELLNNYKKTFLRPHTVSFRGKYRLKRRSSGMVLRPLWVAVATAAAIALLIITFPPGPETNKALSPLTGIADNVQKAEEKKEDEKETKVSEPLPASIKMIRSHSTPVPESSYQKSDKQEAAEPVRIADNNRNTREPVRFAQADINPSTVLEPSVQFDRLKMKPVDPVAVNPGSLSVFDQARIRFRRAAEEAMEEEDALLWSIASSGIRELNKIRNTETEWLASRDENGQISGISFRSPLLSVSAPLNRQEH